MAPGTASYRISLAKYLSRQGSYLEAAESYRDAVALEPNNWDANWGYAEQLWFSDQDDNALKAYESCLRLKADDAPCLSRIARIAWAKGDRVRALASIDRAIARDPKNAGFLCQRADYYRLGREWINAAADYNKALELNVNDADALDGLARVEEDQGRPKMAADFSRRALVIRPDFVSAKLLLSSIMMEQKQYRDAEELLMVAIRAHPDVPEFSINLAICYQKKGQPDSAFSVLRRAVIEFPRSGTLLRMLAIQQRDRGEKTEAVRLYDASVVAEPKDIESRSGYHRRARMPPLDRSSSKPF